MSKTLEELRTSLGRETGLLLEGAATSNSTASVIEDDEGLVRFTEDDALSGGMAYILAAGGAAPEDESRFITDYTAATWLVAVEYDFSAAVATDDTYEIYRVPLSLDQWNECINKAIREAWPEVWLRRRAWFEVTNSGFYQLESDCEDVERVWIRRKNEPNATFGPKLFPGQPLQRYTEWDIRPKIDGTGVGIHLAQIPYNHFAPLKLFYQYKERFAELAAAGDTDLDYPYIMAAAKANLYATLGDDTRGQADESRYLQLLNYWREQAKMRKQELAKDLLTMSPVEAGGKK